jgi:hypothetical protein
MRNDVDKADMARESTIRAHPWWSEHREFLTGAVYKLRRAGSADELFLWHQVLLQRYIQVQKQGDDARRRKQELRRGLADRQVPVARKRELSGAIGDAELDRRVANAIRSSLRDLGDAVAWRLVGYRRGTVAALGHGERVDRLAVGSGREAELKEIRWLWDAKGIFALHCDLTNSIRHADLLSAEEWDPPSLRLSEIKSKGASGPHHRQMVRLQELMDVIAGKGAPTQGAGPYPPRECPVAFRTHHAHLRELIDTAAHATYAWREVEPGFCLVVIDERDPAGLGVQGLDDARRDHLSTQGWGAPSADGPYELSCSSSYRVLRDRRHSFPGQVPLSLLPLPPNIVSAIMCGPLLYWASVDAHHLAARFAKRGIEADIAVGADAGDSFLAARADGRQISMPAPSREMLLIELITIEAIVDVVRWLLDHPASHSSQSEFTVDYLADARLWATGPAPAR